MEVDLSEEDMMIRAIAMSLGQGMAQVNTITKNFVVCFIVYAHGPAHATLFRRGACAHVKAAFSSSKSNITKKQIYFLRPLQQYTIHRAFKAVNKASQVTSKNNVHAKMYLINFFLWVD